MGFFETAGTAPLVETAPSALAHDYALEPGSGFDYYRSCTDPTAPETPARSRRSFGSEKGLGLISARAQLREEPVPMPPRPTMASLMLRTTYPTERARHDRDLGCVGLAVMFRL